MTIISAGGIVGVPVVVPNIRKKFLQTTYTSLSNGAIASPTNNKVFITQIGSTAKIDIVWGAGTATVSTSNAVTFNMPTGMTIDTSLIGGVQQDQMGWANWLTNVSGGTNLPLKPDVQNSTTIIFKKQNNLQTLIESDLGTGWILSATFFVPIVEWAGQDALAYGAGAATAVKSGLVSGGMVPGRLDGVAPAMSMIGEVMLSSLTGVSVAGGGVTNATFLDLTPGEWDMTAVGVHNAGTGNNFIKIGISATSGSFTGTTSGYDSVTAATGNLSGVGAACIPRKIVRVSVTTRYYLVASYDSTTQAMDVSLTARRVG